MRKMRSFDVRPPRGGDHAGSSVAPPSLSNAEIVSRVEQLKREIDRDKQIIRGTSDTRQRHPEPGES